MLNLRERKDFYFTDSVLVKKKNGTNFNNLKEIILLKNSKIVFIHPLKIILPKIKLKLCKKHQKWLMNSLSLTDIFFSEELPRFHFFDVKNTSRFNNSSSSSVNTNFKTSNKQNNPGYSCKYRSRNFSWKTSSTESSSHDKIISSVFCAYCTRQGHIISNCPVLKARKEIIMANELYLAARISLLRL